MKKVSHRGPTNNRCQCIKFSCHGNLAARICSPFSGEVKDGGYSSPDTSTTSPGTISLARIFCTPDLSALTTFPISGSYSFSASMADSAFRSYKFRRNITILRTCWYDKTWIKWKVSSKKLKVPEHYSENKCNITFTDLKLFNESMGSKTNNIMAKWFTFFFFVNVNLYSTLFAGTYLRDYILVTNVAWTLTKYVSLMKRQFVVTCTIHQTENSTVRWSCVTNKPSVKILWPPQKNCLSLYYCKNITYWSVGLSRFGQAFSVSCRTVYQWIMTNCCFMSDIHRIFNAYQLTACNVCILWVFKPPKQCSCVNG